jgi:hypothetical protein
MHDLIPFLGTILAIVAVGGGLLLGLAWIIGDFALKLRETGLKRQMIERGMSVEEIGEVLHISATNGPASALSNASRVED